MSFHVFSEMCRIRVDNGRLISNVNNSVAETKCVSAMWLRRKKGLGLLGLAGDESIWNAFDRIPTPIPASASKTGMSEPKKRKLSLIA